jgi:hypothetical protein
MEVSTMNGDEISSLSREESLELLKVYSRLALTLDGLWFRGIEEKFGLEAAVELDAKTWETFGKSSARRMMKFLGVKEPSILDIAKILILSPVFIFLGPTYEIINEKKGILTVTDCLPQKQRVEMGLGEFPCKPVGIAFFQGFTEVIPQAKIKCLICPPDTHPPDVWCQWEFEI